MSGPASRRLVTVAIPAHNEARALPRTLAAILAEVARPEFSAGNDAELLLGANACADDTVGVFTGALAAAGRPVGAAAPGDRVVATAAPGKTVAWNSLAAAARGEFLVFLDADIVLAPGALAALTAALAADPARLAAGGVLLAPPGPGKGLLYRRLAIKMKEFATKPVPFLNGPFYALRRGAVTAIPAGIINEDTWLNLALGSDRIRTVPGAVGWQAPPARWDEYYRRQVRIVTGDRQLRATEGERYAAFRRATADPRTRRERAAALTAAERRLKRLTFWIAWRQHWLDRRARAAADRFARDQRWAECPWGATASSKDYAVDR